MILRISQLVYMIATKFQRLHPRFRSGNTYKFSVQRTLPCTIHLKRSFRTLGIIWCTSGCISITAFKPGNMGVAVGIPLLSCIRAEIDVIAHLRPINCLPSLIYDIPIHWTVFPVVYPCYLTPET